MNRGPAQKVTAKSTPGDLVVFLTYLRRSFHPVQDLAKYTGRLAKASAAGHRVLDLLNRQPEIHDSPDAIVASALRGAVEFDSVSFSCQPDRLVLQEICFCVEPGQLVALTGESGIGKSTVLGLILRLYDPAGIRLSDDGRRITNLSHVGYPDFSQNLPGFNAHDLQKEPVAIPTKGIATTYEIAYHPTLPIAASPGDSSAVLYDRETGKVLEERTAAARCRWHRKLECRAAVLFARRQMAGLSGPGRAERALSLQGGVQAVGPKR